MNAFLPSNNVLQARYIILISELLNAQSHAVKYEAATTLTSLTQNPAAIKGQSWQFTHGSKILIYYGSCCILLHQPGHQGV